jgi:ubiquinone/menaquinone biosynthesis C-methylase UbiE
MGIALFKSSRHTRAMAVNSSGGNGDSQPVKTAATTVTAPVQPWDTRPKASAEFYPFFEGQPGSLLRSWDQNPEISPADGLPIPPDSLRSGYGSESAAYLASGQLHHRKMMGILTDSSFVLKENDRILDFGCSSGRMLRCFHKLANSHEAWGVDISAEHILWCQDHLSPPFRFTTTTTFPHLPFEDNSFGLIYAGSVFTHIGDMEDAWLLELRRILRPGGHLYATVHDNHTIDILISSPPGHWLHDWYVRKMLLEYEAQHNFLQTGFKMFSITVKAGSSQIFHDREYLSKKWNRFLAVHSVHPEAYSYQTAILMSK